MGAPSHPRSTSDATGKLLLHVLSLTVLLCIAGGQHGATAARGGAPVPVATRFVAVNGSDSGPCTRAAPCATFRRAYTLARRGEVVEVTGGVYGRQVIGPDTTKDTGEGVVAFRSAPSGSVTVAGLTVAAGATHVAFQDMEFVDGWEVGPSDGGAPAQDVTFRNVRGRLFSILNAVGVRVIGGAYGPSVNDHPQVKVWNPGDRYAPTNILIQGVTFHGFVRSNPEVHTECLQIYAGIGVTIRGNRFRNCDGTGSLTISSEFGTAISDFLIENNIFEAGDGTDEPYYDVQLELCGQHMVMRYNSFVKGIALNNCSDRANGELSLIANYGPASGAMCGSGGVTYSYNVWVGADAQKCASTDRVSHRLQYVDPNGHDLHLAQGATAVNAGDPANFPRRDFDGDLRATDGRPDAGADERQTPCKNTKSHTCKK